MRISTVAIAMAAAAEGVAAWGALGHQTVALLAQQYLLPKTITEVRKILGSDLSKPTYMGDVATWADSFRYEAGGEWSGGLHFINGKDKNPPESCKLTWPTDCPEEGCIVKAIGNYTDLIKSKKTPDAVRFQALKFVIHFLGDIAQPLHTEAYGAGANNITVYFNGYKTNLHAAWDTAIPNSIFGMLPNATITSGDALGFANNLAADINMGKYEHNIWSWLKNHDIRTISTIENSAITWAREANMKVCDAAISIHPEKLQNAEIGSGEYVERARDVVQMSIARAGIRLAGWLNLIYAGRTGFEGIKWL